MTFEKDFPTLAENEEAMNKFRGAVGGSDAYFQSAIRRCCLDKQRVRDAIEKFIKELDGDVPAGWFEPLKKELGL